MICYILDSLHVSDSTNTLIIIFDSFHTGMRESPPVIYDIHKYQLIMNMPTTAMMLLIRHQGLCGHGWYLYIPTYIWFIRHLESLHIAKFTNATTKGFDFFSRWHIANLTNTARIVFGLFSYWHGRPPPVLHPWILTHHEYANHSYDATYWTSRSLQSWVIPLHPNTHMIH